MQTACYQNVSKPGFGAISQLAKTGGGGGIRTHGTLARTTVFETAPFDHSGTPPIQANCGFQVIRWCDFRLIATGIATRASLGGVF